MPNRYLLIGISTAIAFGSLAIFACMKAPVPTASTANTDGLDTQLRDDSNGTDWVGYGRTYGEQHFSPLADINDGNVGKLGLAWAIDLGEGNPASIPIVVNGILFMSTGLSYVRAVDASTGKQLWTYDSKVAQHNADKIRPAWGIRGIAYWNGKVITGTQDGRLIALDAKTGAKVWSVITTEPSDGRFITGAPRVFAGKVIIGNGGADTSDSRGYVTTYDADTGKQLWRFYIVPGNPAKGFENSAQAMAAKTWKGEWWKYGGGGNAWNAFTYDAAADTVIVGTGNGAPWNQKIRSPGGGDNLFLSSVVGLDAKTGFYKWHYQVNPGETWDYNASMDMPLADLVIDGKLRKVVMQAPKNGFFYVIDRTNGKLISAEKFAKVTWASRIDKNTGRPVETPGARFPDGKSFELWPSYTGAHSWMPMAYSPKTQLVYIPKIETGALYDDRGVSLSNWHRPPNNMLAPGVNINPGIKNPLQNTSALLAWNPVTQKKAWQVDTVGGWSGGVLATGGNLVFQGQLNGRFSAYAATSGKELWNFPAQSAIIAAPISYRAHGRQYITVLVGMGTTPGTSAATLGGISIDYRTQARRVLTFIIGGTARLPVSTTGKISAQLDPEYKPQPALAARGEAIYNGRCVVCHGFNAQSGGTAPDLRASAALTAAEAFDAIVRGGALVENGMPRFHELKDNELSEVRQYLRSRSKDLRGNK